MDNITRKIRELERLKGAGSEGGAFGRSAQQVYQREQSQVLGGLREEFNTRERYSRNQQRQLDAINKQIKESENSEAKKKKLVEERLELEKKIAKVVKEQGTAEEFGF